MDTSIDAAIDAAFEYARAHGFGAYATPSMVRAAIAAYRDAEIERLKNELEIERLRLAACGVAALGYFEGCLPEYRSASLDDVFQLRAKLDASNKELREIAESINDPRVNLTMTTVEWCIEAQAKLEAAERDAARWREFRSHHWTDGNDTLIAVRVQDVTLGTQTYTHEILDAAIDAARGGERG